MAAVEEPAALAHIEKTLADGYRKEIDQEENIWRVLSFFAATLALQLAALFQLLERLPPSTNIWGIIARSVVALSLLCSIIALGYLAASISPAGFRYIAKDAALLDYALGLIKDEQDAVAAGLPVEKTALVILKETLANQYSLAADHNRQITKRRSLRRSIAGLATIAAVLLTLMVVIAAFGYAVVAPTRG